MNYRAFCGPSYTSQSRVANAVRCLNWYPERLGAESRGAKVEWVLYPTPGVTTFATASGGPGRAFYKINERVFAVIGPTLYELFADGTITARGTVLVDEHPATIRSNGDAADELFITSGGAGYIYDLVTDTLTAVAALATGTDMGEYLDGYFLALDHTTSTLRISDLTDGTTWQVLQAQQRNAAPDRWQRVLVANRDIWLFGSETSDIWYNAGTFPFPFQPRQGANVEWGIGAAFSAAVLGSPVWLAANKDGDRIVLQATDGYAARRISNHALEHALGTYGTISDARGFTYQQDGHTFYALTFPTAQHTWCYDAATQLWHERAFWNTVTAEEEAWRPLWHVKAFGKNLTLDRNTGVVHELSLTAGFDADGAAIRRVRRAPHIEGVDRPRLFIPAFEVDLENGLGLPTGQGVDPQVMLRYATDGGRRYSPERWTTAGAQGQYTVRTFWTRLGSGRDWVFEVAVSDPIPWRLIAAYLGPRRGAG